MPTRTDAYSFCLYNLDNGVDYTIYIYDDKFNELCYTIGNSMNLPKISFALKENKKYYVVIKNNTSNCEAHRCRLMIINEEKTMLSSEGDFSLLSYSSSNGIVNNYKDGLFFNVKPDYTQNYIFYTTLQNGYNDLLMYVYDENFVLLDSGDDELPNRQPRVSILLEEGKNYYILVNQYSFANSSNVTNFRFYMTLGR